MQTEVILKYRANNRGHRADQAQHGTPEHIHTNTHSSDHKTLGTPPRRASRVPWVPSLLLACSAPAARAVRAALAPLSDESARRARSRAHCRNRRRRRLRAAGGRPMAAAAAELLAKDARMTAGEVSMPVGRGGGLKQPPGRRSVACCSAAGSHRACDRAARGACGRGLWVPMRGKHARLAIGMMSDTCQGHKDSSQCTERSAGTRMQ